MTTRQRIFRLGADPAVILPDWLLAETRLDEGDEVEIRAGAGQTVLRPARWPREGWDEQFAEMARQGDDRRLDED